MHTTEAEGCIKLYIKEYDSHYTDAETYPTGYGKLFLVDTDRKNCGTDDSAHTDYGEKHAFGDGRSDKL